jgi:hypothetical protein
MGLLFQNKRINRVLTFTYLGGQNVAIIESQELELFAFFTKVGAGLPLWLPKELH